MNGKVKSYVKIYLIEIIFLAICLISYALYLSNTNNDSNKIMEMTIGILAFMLLGILYGNHFHKRGLIIGLVMGLLHLFLLKIILLLTSGDFNLNIIATTIFVLASGIGGLIGLYFKKII